MSVAIVNDPVAQTPRLCSPEQTLENIEPWLKRAGVTRLADITGLDNIGFPCFASIRPDSASLAVDSGKGITKAHAKASAAMEALERWALDEVPVERLRKSTLPSLTAFPCISKSPKRATQHWTSATEISTGDQYQVPYYAVKLYDDNPTLQDRVFIASTNGMASGNTREEAIAGGIFEVIERDAIHVANLNQTMRRFDIGSSRDEFTNEAIYKIHGAGCELFAYDCTSDVGIPVFLAIIVDKEKGTGNFKGYGCHLCPDIALNRAICEAAQARCVIMSGTRDDITWAHHRRVLAATETKDWVAEIEKDPISTRYQDMSDLSTGSVDGDVDKALSCLHIAGFDRVLVADFPIEGAPFSCVKVLIPKMASYFFLHGTELGRLDGRP